MIKSVYSQLLLKNIIVTKLDWLKYLFKRPSNALPCLARHNKWLYFKGYKAYHKIISHNFKFLYIKLVDYILYFMTQARVI